MTAFLLSLTESQTLQALRMFLLDILPAGVEVVRGQVNRVPEVKSPDFVVQTPILRSRIGTNVDSYSDLAFTASITGTVMTVTAVSVGLIVPGTAIAGAHLTFPTGVVDQISGPTGGVGTYRVTPSQTAVSELVWGGVINFLNEVEVTVQLDVHGPNSADNAHKISTLLRDAYATTFFAEMDFDVSPLYAEEPKQMPFDNENQQVEERYVVDAVLQANPVITGPQQFASVLSIVLVDVDAVYPPT